MHKHTLTHTYTHPHMTGTRCQYPQGTTVQCRDLKMERPLYLGKAEMMSEKGRGPHRPGFHLLFCFRRVRLVGFILCIDMCACMRMCVLCVRACVRKRGGERERAGSHITQAGLKFTMWPGMTLNSCPSCSSCPSSGMLGFQVFTTTSGSCSPGAGTHSLPHARPTL